MKNLYIKAIDSSCSKEEFIKQIQEVYKHIACFDEAYQLEDNLDELSHKALNDRLNALLTYLRHLIERDTIN